MKVYQKNLLFINNDELKYSLRSIEKYAPWINKIFIVTDNQIPQWLDLNHPKIKIADHTEIIPQEKLPLFNSCAIESRILFIPDLSEHFLYANDDTFFWDYVTPEFFFQNGKSILRFRKKLNINKKSTLYTNTLKKAYDVVSAKYKLQIKPQVPHHNIDSYKKFLFHECLNEFNQEFDETLNHRYRDFGDMQRIVVSFYMLAKDEAIPKHIELNWVQKHLFNTKADSQFFGMNASKMHKLETVKTHLLCINDSPETTVEDRIKTRTLPEKKFPVKCSFEK